MQIFNTYSRQLETFESIDDKKVRMYTCGPTVYNYAHIGNFRAYMFEDILRRQLKAAGYEVCQVMNLTDVDDKTIRGAREAGISLDAYTKTFKDAFFADIDRLSIERAEHYPAATDHIAGMIVMIEKLLASGHAYRSDDGCVYYKVASFADYGRLAHMQLENLQVGSRVAHDEYEKDHVADFALWKAWDESDGDVGWDSPWGRGRPGWHIECSAMSKALLGEQFDLHTGGVDNIFPHHENEIAQSEGASGCKPFVRYWMHCGYLIVDGAKMSKSSGNFYTLREILEKGYTGRQVRYVLLSAHYRQPLNFTFAALDAAATALARVDEFVARIEERAAAGATSADALPDWAATGEGHFREAMAADLNTPEALAALFDLVTAGNRALDGGCVTAGEAVAVRQLIEQLDQVLGVLSPDPVGDGPDARALELLAQRQAARQGKDWATADRLRDELLALGWEARDTADGAKLKRRS